ncbi:MAG: hypothetical protein GWN71_33615, partial [Gammaproteobacteria bacterium]|nr:hypothetical protein [Gemmatimonadota bacterium]NIU78318.1 hypothetical protein [Gammaproteobacteria bacterium]
MSGIGLPVERLPLTPFRSMHLWAAQRGPFRIRARRPLFYLARRGPEK